MERNEDYCKGIKYLMTECRKMGIKYQKYPWLTDLCRLLSKSGNCYNFWYEVKQQRKIDKIPFCNTVYDILFNNTVYFLFWSKTSQGHDYWATVFKELFYSGVVFDVAGVCKDIQLSELRKRCGDKQDNC